MIYLWCVFEMSQREPHIATTVQQENLARLLIRWFGGLGKNCRIKLCQYL